MSDDELIDEKQTAIREATPVDLDGLAVFLDEISDLHVAALPECFRAVDGRAQAQWMLGLGVARQSVSRRQ